MRACPSRPIVCAFALPVALPRVTALCDRLASSGYRCVARTVRPGCSKATFLAARAGP